MVAIAAAFVGVYLARQHRAAESPTVPADPLAALGGASGWLNGGPLGADSLRGHDVVVMLWSDSDPVSLARLPDVQAWQQAYGRYGVRVIGVHEPEYAFAADSAVPGRALRRAGVTFPVALDAGYRVGSRVGAEDDLPAWVVVDAHGARAFAASGDRAEFVHQALRALVRRERPDAGLPEDAAPPATTDPAAVRRVFFGSSRATGPLAQARPGETETFTAQFRFQEEGEAYTPYVVGRWTPSSDGVTSARGGASDYAAMRLEGGEVSAVIGATQPTRVWVLSDDAWLPESARGGDVHADARGATYLEVSEPRLYTIGKLAGPHAIKLSPEGPGVTFYEVAVR